jgi:hypothetical protein
MNALKMSNVEDEQRLPAKGVSGTSDKQLLVPDSSVSCNQFNFWRSCTNTYISLPGMASLGSKFHSIKHAKFTLRRIGPAEDRLKTASD